MTTNDDTVTVNKLDDACKSFQICEIYRFRPTQENLSAAMLNLPDVTVISTETHTSLLHVQTY